MSRQGFSKRLLVVQKWSKVELLVPCEFEIQRSQFIVAVEELAFDTTLIVRQSALMSNLGIILLPLFTFCLEHFDVCR
jgi:hypothetical protein